MEAVVAFICVVFVVVAAWLEQAGVREERNRLFKGFLRTHGGHFLEEASAWGTLPSVQTMHDGRPVTLAETSTGGKHPVFYTEARLEIGATRVRGLEFDIYPENFTQSVAKFFGAQDVQAADPAFDSLFMLKSTDEAALRTYLDPEARMVLKQLYDLPEAGDLEVRFDGRALTVKKRSRFETVGLEQFYGLCSRLFDRTLEFGADPSATLAEGDLHFISDSPEAAAEASVCQVCGGAIDGPCMRCAACNTPHHPECWTYNDEKCSTYGCGSTSGRRC